MAKAATKSQIIAKIAEDADISKVQAKVALESLVAQAYAGAEDGFTVPGLGKLVKQDRAERQVPVKRHFHGFQWVVVNSPDALDRFFLGNNDRANRSGQ